MGLYASTNVCLVTEAHRCEKLVQGLYAVCPAETQTYDLLIARPTLYRLRHDATYLFIYLSICLSVCLSVCLSIYLSIYLFIMYRTITVTANT